MQCNSTTFTAGCLLNFRFFIKNYPACRPAACKKFKPIQLGLESRALFCFPLTLKFFWEVSENFVQKRLEYIPETFNFNSFTVWQFEIEI